MAATVTGTFLLIDRASGPLKRIERQAQQTDRAIADLGSRLDNIGTQSQMDQHEKLGRSLRDIDTNANVATGGMDELSDSIDHTSDVANRATGRMGRMGRTMLLVGGAIGALLPIVIDLAGALGALVGSLGAAIKGVGALGVALGGSIVVGLAGVAGAALAASDRMKNLKGEVKDLKENWQGLTVRGSNDFMAMIRDSMADMEKLMPMLAESVNRTMPAARDAVDQFFQRLDSPQFTRFVERMTTTFERVAGPLAQTLASVGQTLGNIAVAAAPFVEEMVRGISDITRGWAKSTNNIEGLRASIKKAVDQARSWFRLLSATWDLTLAVFGSGADEGQGLVNDMTKKVEKYTKWVTKNPDKMNAFWKDSIQGTKELARFLGSLRLPLKNLNDAMEPLVRFFERLTGALARLTIPGTDISALTGLVTAVAAVKGAKFLGGLGAATRGTYANPMIVKDVGFSSRNRNTTAAPGTTGPGSKPTETPEAKKGGIGGFFSRVGGAIKSGVEKIPGGKAVTGGLGKVFGGIKGAAGRMGAGAVSRFPVLGTLGKVAPFIGPLLFANEIARGEGSLPERITNAGNIIDPTTLVAMMFDADNPSGLYKRLAEKLGGGPGLPEAGEFFGPGFQDFLGTSGYRRQQRRQARAARRGVARGVNAQAPGTAGAVLGLPTLGQLKEQIKVPKLDDKEFKTSADAIEKKATKLNQMVKDDTSDKWHKTRRAMVGQMKEALPELELAMKKIRDMTIGELKGMGYKDAEARNMMNFANGGGGQGKGDGLPAGGRNKRPKNNAMGGRLNGYASGGRLSGMGHRDTVPLVHGMAAPGELIVNRHTEGRVNSMLGMFGTNLGREVGNETVPHSGTPRPGQPGFKENAAYGMRVPMFARGGRRGRRGVANSNSILAAGRLGTSMGLNVAEGPGYGGIPSGGHAPGSLHYQGLAYDVSGSAALMRRYFHAALRSFGSSINELFYDPIGWYIDGGSRVPGAIGGHSDHVHIGFNPGGATGAPIGGMTAGPPQQISLRAPRSRLRGAPGMMSQGGMNAMTRGMERAINRRLRGGGGMAGGGTVVRGRATYFGGGTMASGLNTDVNPGIALNPNPGGPDPGSWDNKQTDAWLNNRQRFLVRVGGKSAILPMLDKGPAGWTGNAIDVNMAGLAKMGFTTGNFPSGTVGTATAMAKGGRMPRFGGWYGNGGKFTADQPTLIGVGERGKETVEITPASKGSAGRGGGKGVTIGNITINNHREGDIRKQVKRELAQAFNELEREIKSDTGNGIV